MSALIEAAGKPEFAAEIILVLSDKPDAAGLVAARAAGVTAKAIDYRCFSGREAFETELHGQLAGAGIELVCLAGFMRILSPKLVERWRGRMLNIHPSLLPELRGLRTHERALAEGNHSVARSSTAISSCHSRGESPLVSGTTGLPAMSRRITASPVAEISLAFIRYSRKAA